MLRKITFTFFIGIFPMFLWANSHIPQTSIQDQIRLRLENIQPGERLNIRNKNLKTSDEIYSFYANREFKEAWSSNGILTEIAYELRFEIKQAEFDGLNPSDYNLALIESFFKSFEENKKRNSENDTEDLADLDLILSDAFFHLSSHLELGKVDPTKIDSNWEIIRKSPKVNHPELLETALQSGSIRKSLESLYPSFTMYRKGREVIRALDEKRKSDSTDWKAVKIDKTLKVGDANSGIPALRERLVFWNYLEIYELENPKFYDSVMFVAVKEFQKRNGMEPDGALGKMTVNALNQSPRILMDRAAVNMERLRWLPDSLRDSEMIVVNIANFQLDYLSKGDTLFSGKVIVGKQYHASPIFSAPMKYIVFSPYWNVPNSIARNELIPSIRRNPNYLRQKNMEVVTHSGKLVDPSTINWSSKSFPYMIRQKPGGENSLGLVKFMFPNKHSVYLHDTPSKSLFEREDRALSHGCIRLQHPEKLAKLLLNDMPGWTDEKIQEAMHQTKEQIVNLNREIPVVLIYLTFWADSNGQGHFRPDIYGRDGEVLTALRK
ncbi:MAG: L,D-transpeptidase family protein [Algoriphagus sp.]|nr:L,D-transpeptidase family protein [Algoriphagus sp.]